MAFNNPNNDDYNKDIKLDQSVQLGDSPCHISWMNITQSNNFPVHFAATFWDKTVRIFEITQNHAGGVIVQKAITNLPSFGTCCTWNADNSSLYIGCSDGSIKNLDINNMSFGSDAGKQNAGISSLHYVPQLNSVVSTGYENTVNFWSGSPNPAMSIDVEGKIFCSDFKNGIMAGGTLGEKIFLIDVNKLANGPNKTIHDSNDLGKFSQLQCVSLDNKAETIGIATADGRANISGLTRSYGGGGDFKFNSIITFKANKQDEAGSIILYPVNASSFSAAYENWFMTAGSDGVMSFWDYKARNKIRGFSFSGIPVCTAAMSPTGNMVAYGLGNDWHIGAEGVGKWQNKIGVHMVADNETKYQGTSKKGP